VRIGGHPGLPRAAPACLLFWLAPRATVPDPRGLPSVPSPRAPASPAAPTPVPAPVALAFRSGMGAFPARAASIKSLPLGASCALFPDSEDARVPPGAPLRAWWPWVWGIGTQKGHRKDCVTARGAGRPPGRGTRRGGLSAPQSGQGAPSFRCLPASSKNMKVWAGWCGNESPSRALVR
jgi:hypothetical protein